MRVRCLFAAVFIGLVWAGPARAALPPTFFGMQVDGPVVDGPLNLSEQLTKMRQTGVGTVRFTILWSDAQPYASWAEVPPDQAGRFVDAEGVPLDFSQSDRLVAAAVAAGTDPLPVVMNAPPWARRNPKRTWSSPSAIGRRGYARFLTALVHRYGPGGSFWTANPTLPQRPLRQWQIWNEPNGQFFWNEQPGIPAYAKLLKVAYPAVHGADPGAKVVSAGLFGDSWEAMAQLYKRGARPFFDIAAVHPFTLQVQGVATILRRFRFVMGINGDARKRLMITELSWPASKDKTSIQTGFDVTAQGQAKRVAQVYPMLAKLRSRMRLIGVVWSTWVTSYTSKEYSFDYSGLFRLDGDQTDPMPSFDAFSSAVRQLSAR